MESEFFMKHNMTYRRGTGVFIIKPGSVGKPELLVGQRHGACPPSWQVPEGGKPRGRSHHFNALARVKQELGLEAHELFFLGMTGTRTSYRLEVPHEHGFRGEEHRWVVFRYAGESALPNLERATQQVFNDLLWAPLRWVIENTAPFRVKPYTTAIPEVERIYRAYA